METTFTALDELLFSIETGLYHLSDAHFGCTVCGGLGWPTTYSVSEVDGSWHITIVHHYYACPAIWDPSSQFVLSSDFLDALYYFTGNLGDYGVIEMVSHVGAEIVDG